MQEPTVNSFSNLLLPLKNPQKVEELSKLVHDKVFGTVSIACREDESQKSKIYFLIDSKRQLNLFELSDLTTAIKERLGYDYTVLEDDDVADCIFVELRSLYDQEKIAKLFSDITSLSKENFRNVELFLNKHYSHVFQPLQKENTVSNSYSSLFLSDQSLDIEVVEQLKANPKLWDRLSNVPDKWDTAQKSVKKELDKAKKEREIETRGNNLSPPPPPTAVK